MDVVAILQDKSTNFWFVTMHHGVYRYDGKSFTNFLPNEVLICITEDRSGNIWVGSWRHGGVYRYDGKSFTNFSGISDDMIFCLMKDKAGNIWIGTRDHGVDRYNGETITNFSKKDGFCNNNVSCIFEDVEGNIWFGSDVVGDANRGDVCKFDGKHFTNLTAKETLTDKDKIAYSVRTIVQDNCGNLWIGSRAGLLLRFDGKSFTDFSGNVSD
jgi:ligand-binding sensor domain-containing protein